MTDGGVRERELRHTLHGEPALLLIESLIHELVEHAVIDHAQAIEIVSLALEAQVAHCDDRDEDVRASPSIAALGRIRLSLSIDAQSTVLDGVDPVPMADRAFPLSDGQL